jgi:hypothetical protein
LNATDRKSGQPGLGSAALYAIADLKPPFPDLRIGGGDYAVFNAFVDHGSSLFPRQRAGEQLFRPSINPDVYGKRAESGGLERGLAMSLVQALAWPPRFKAAEKPPA